MTPELWRKMSQALAELLALDKEHRAAQLNQLWQTDSLVAAEVEGLLLQHETSNPFDLESAVAGIVDSLPPVAQAKGPTETPTDELPEQVGPYRVLEEVGHGGMGVVYRVRDNRFRRSLAVKVLAAAHGGNAGLHQRFEEEALLMGQLQHPGITPVHDRGLLPDGRPYFVMKLIDGRNLAALLRERTDLDKERGRFLDIFEQVCRTLAYTHAHRIIHRDLKPANIMVGPFGEVQVMDWGLAKEYRQGPDAGRLPAPEGERPDTLPSGSASVTPVGGRQPTMAGEVMGTPSYMAPEQARGEIDQVDARVDVFALGGILCEVLTGRPVFTGTSTAAILGKARAGNLDDAFTRLATCGGDVELIALARHCLDPQPALRPADAAAVVQALTNYRAGVEERLRRAELERAAATAKAAEQKKRRRVQLALAAALALLLFGGGAFAWWSDHQASVRSAERAIEASRARRAVEAGLDQAEDGLRGERLLDTEAALKQANQHLGEQGPTELRDRRDALQQDLAMVRTLDRIRDHRWVIAGGRFDLAGALRDYPQAFRAYRLQVQEADVNESAQRITASPIGWRLIRGLDDWLVIADDAGLRRALASLLAAVDPDDFRTAFRTALATQDQERLRKLAEANLETQPSAFIAVIGDVKTIYSDRRRALLLEAWARHPDDFVLAFELANNPDSEDKKTADVRISWFRTALARKPDNAAAWNNLGNALDHKGDVAAALASYQRAIALDPGLAMAHANLGTVLQEKGDFDAAMVSFRRAIALDPGLAMAHNNLGSCLHHKGELDAAIASCRRAIALDPGLAMAHNNLGICLPGKGDLDGAIASFRRAVDLNPALVEAHCNLGIALCNKGDLDGGISSFRRAVEIEPQSALMHYCLGSALDKKGDYEGAILSFRRATALNSTFVDAYTSLGHALLASGDFREARAAYQRVLALLPAQSPVRPTVSSEVTRCQQLQAAEERLADMLAARARPANAVEAVNLAQFCSRYKKQHATAVRFYEQAFAADMAIVNDLGLQAAYHAARAACLAGCGQGQDAPPEAERPRLRRRALAWLGDDLAALDKLFMARPEEQIRMLVQSRMQQWLEDPDLKGVRDAAELAQLPEEERRDWENLWMKVRQLRDQTAPAMK